MDKSRWRNLRGPNRTLSESELDAALRALLIRPVPSSVAGEVRIAVADAGRRETTRPAPRRSARLIVTAGGLTLAVAGALLLSISSGSIRTGTGQKDSGARSERQRLLADHYVAGRSPSTLRSATNVAASEENSMPRIRDTRGNVRGDLAPMESSIPVAIWIDEPVTVQASAPPDVPPDPPIPQTSTGSVVVTDELRGLRTTYEMTREQRAGETTQVVVTFQQQDLRAHREENNSHASS